MPNFKLHATCKIQYLDIGVSTGNHAPILFLHGWGLDGRTFLPSLSILSQNRRVISPDLPGFGKSKCDLDQWHYGMAAQTIIDLISTLGIEKVHLMGHSIGAGVCMKICTLIPDRVLSLTLVDSAGAPFRSFENLIIRRLISLSEQMVAQFLLSPRYSLSYIKPMLYNIFFNRKSVFQALAMPLHEDIVSTARQIQNKTLIVWGEKDRTTPVEMGKTLSQNLLNSRLLVLRGSYYHEWSILNPLKFAKIANDFLDSTEQSENS